MTISIWLFPLCCGSCAPTNALCCGICCGIFCGVCCRMCCAITHITRVWTRCAIMFGPNVVYAVNEEVKRRAWSEYGSCRVCGGVWAEIGGNMRRNLCDCAACRIYDECPFEPHRWKMLMKHPFRAPRGSVAITEVMRHFGSLLYVWEQHTENRLC
jgi:hypothetical protein